jgi:hypothetical protein
MAKKLPDIIRMIGLARQKQRSAEKEKRSIKKIEKPNVITEFDGVDDWIMSSVLVAIMHANPGITPDEAVQKCQEFARKLYTPNSSHLWRRQVDRLSRIGLRAIASRIRRELHKLL